MSTNFNYGVIGNCRSAALVSENGSIDWCCLPDFHSPSVFARLLDKERGGYFAFEPLHIADVLQEYVPNTNILCTRFVTTEGSFEVIDFMPYYIEDGEYETHPEIIRYIRLLYGMPQFRVVYRPALGYAQYPTETKSLGSYIKSATQEGAYESIYLYTSFDHRHILESAVITLESDGFFLLNYNQKLLHIDLDRVILKLERTKVHWMNWVAKTLSYSFANPQVIRSALVLKLLTYQKTGAILAAATTSLPEIPGAERNWDYRYCWIRDASMMVNVLLNLGHSRTALRFLKFIFDVIPFKNENLQIMYGIRGEKQLVERELSWLEGNRNSRPVRVGNAAFDQRQNDVYGVLIDVIHQYFQYFRNSLVMSEDLWTIVRSLCRHVENNWKKPDAGIWEFRNRQEHFVYSKLMSWVAMDRAARIARMLDFEDQGRTYQGLADEIKHDLFTHGFNPKVGAFTQYYGSDNMDAANLLLQHYGLIEADDERYIDTVLKTKEELLHQGLMYRYKSADDFGQPRTAFTICTFWMIKSLHLIGQKEEAQQLFHKVLGHANHLGLFSEGIDFETGDLVGNFPQGYSHLALIDTAITLSEKSIDTNSKILTLLKGAVG